MASSFLLSSYALFLLFSSLLVEAEVGHHLVRVSSLLPSPVCSSSKEPENVGLKVVHRHGPCSPLKKKKKTDHNLILTQDQSRVDSLHRRQHRQSTASTITSTAYRRNPIASAKIPARPGSSLGTGNYIVTVGFGTPKSDYSVVFDTGSDVTWIQCQPCVGGCYQQEEPIFDPRASSSYSNISCSSVACSQLDTNSCSGTTCLYAVQYGDNSYSVGFFAQDTLTLSSDVLPGFKFGCGEKNKGLFGKEAGLLGLGREPTSFVSQTTSKYGGVFSYCLPSSASGVGYLNFGAASSAANAKYTPMLTDSSMPTFYFVDLEAIYVAGTKLPVAPTVFSNAGTLLDSGTVISRLPPEAYSALRSAFKAKMTQYPAAPALSILDTCYDFSNYTTVSIPTVALQFGRGVTVYLDFWGILYAGSTSQVCLAFAGNSDAGDLGIVGNVQQKTIGIVYNVPKRVIGFAKAGCS